MNGLGYLSNNGVIYHHHDVVYNDSFLDSIIQDSLANNFIALHPGSVDPLIPTKWVDIANQKLYAINGTTPVFNQEGSLTFDGSTNYLVHDWNLTEAQGYYFTLEIFIRPTNIGNTQVFGSSVVGSNLVTTSNGLLREFTFVLSTPGGNAGIATTTPHKDNGLFQWVATRIDRDLFIYINGKFVNRYTGSLIDGPLTNTPNQIGQYRSGLGLFYTGRYYSHRVYRRVLSAEEIAFNYNNNINRYPV